MPATWLAFARRDVQAADVLRHNGIYEESCFHAQQAAEKASKVLPQEERYDTQSAAADIIVWEKSHGRDSPGGHDAG
jgi:hypothetical protein